METKQMSLSQCAKYDFETKAKQRLSLWGRKSLERQVKGISRKQRRLRKQGT